MTTDKPTTNPLRELGRMFIGTMAECAVGAWKAAKPNPRMSAETRALFLDAMRARERDRIVRRAGDQAALLVAAGFITGLALVLFSAHLALNL